MLLSALLKRPIDAHKYENQAAVQIAVKEDDVVQSKSLQSATQDLHVERSLFAASLGFSSLTLTPGAFEEVLFSLLGARLALTAQRHLSTEDVRLQEETSPTE